MAAPPRKPSIRDMQTSALDRTYEAITRSMQAAIQRDIDETLKPRLDELQKEAERLAETGDTLSLRNAIIAALIADLVQALIRQTRRIDSLTGALTQSGINAANQLSPVLAFGMSSQQLAGLGYAWNQPSMDALRAAAEFTSSDEWQAALGLHRENIIKNVNAAIINGIARGKSPLVIAKHLTDLINTLPLSRAQNLMRTLQLVTYRTASTVHEIANSRILEKKIRIAALDDRTCLACIALHGTDMKIGERVNDHHNGRCTAVYVPKGRTVNITSGVQWFNALPPERQAKIAGAANFNAMQSGKAQLRDFVGTYQDDVFGPMIREMSLKGILGDVAKQYYARAS